MSRHTKSVPPWALRRMRNFILERDGHQCVLCGSRARLECDHIVPIADGGEHVPENCRTLCRACHIAETRKRWTPPAKGADEWAEFAAATGHARRKLLL